MSKKSQINLSYFRRELKRPYALLLDESFPQIKITPIAYSKMIHFVDIATDEVGWFGQTSMLPNGDIIIKDVYLFKQQVSASTTLITEEGLAQFANEILKREDGMEIVNNLQFWGHSHVYMRTSPSQQDNDQMETFQSSGYEWLLRGIFNKHGEVNFSLYDYKKGLIINNVEWMLVVPEEADFRKHIEIDFKEKVEKIVPKKFDYKPGYIYDQKSGKFFPPPETYSTELSNIIDDDDDDDDLVDDDDDLLDDDDIRV